MSERRASEGFQITITANWIRMLAMQRGFLKRLKDNKIGHCTRIGTQGGRERHSFMEKTSPTKVLGNERRYKPHH